METILLKLFWLNKTTEHSEKSKNLKENVTNSIWIGITVNQLFAS